MRQLFGSWRPWGRAYFVLFALACSDVPSFVSTKGSSEQQTDSLYGDVWIDDGPNPSRAEDLHTIHGVQGAVGALFDAQGAIICGGTLVSPIHFLTAAHCFDKQPDGSLYVSFPQEPGEHFQEAHRHSWFKPSEGGDLAILTLQTEVPKAIVRRYPKANAGDLDSFIARAKQDEFVIVGFGPHGPDQWQLNVMDGKRRYGYTSGVVMDYAKPPPPAIQVAYNLNHANPIAGDSGSPLFGRDPDTNEYVLIGVYSFGTHWDDPYSSWYAFVGTSGTYDQNIYPYMGADEDADGVPDIVDNCPPRLCLEIGDGRSCANSRQLDRDGDGIGDVCDVCPGLAVPEDAEPDGKSVGDSCGCVGKELAYLPCTKGSTVCEDNFAGSCLFDYDKDGQPLPGLCATLPDEDRDGYPDECEYCPRWDGRYKNSNSHVERDLGVEQLTDRCEGVPLYVFEESVSTYWRKPIPAPGAGGLGVDVVKLTGYPWLGEFSSVSLMHEEVEFRHCSCYDEEGWELDPRYCAQERCQASNAEGFKDGWVAATVSTSRQANSPIPSQQFKAYDSGNHPWPFNPYPPWYSWDTLYWKSYGDINRPSDPVEGQGAESFGVLASVVLRDGGVLASTRDASYKLRTALRAVRSPFYDVIPDDYDLLALLQEPIQNCDVVDCFDFITFPTKFELAVHPYPSDPLPLFVYEGLAAMLLRDGGFSPVSDYLEPALVEALSSRNWTIVTVSEDSGTLARLGMARVGVLIARSGADGLKPIELYDDNGIIRLRELPEFASSSEELARSVQLHQSEKAVYSGRENRLIVMGNEPSIRIYDLGSEFLRQVFVDRTPSTRLGGLTLNRFNQKLYALEISASAEYGDVASIYEYDLGSGSSVQLLSVPYTGTYERTALLADSEDTLILMGSKGAITESWRFIANESGTLEQIGKRVDEGSLFSEPHHSTQSAVMEINGQLFLMDIHHEGFLPDDVIQQL